MTFNYTTLQAECNKCQYQWRARTSESVPRKCPSCGSMAWRNGIRKFSNILSRAGGEDAKTGAREFCILDVLTEPSAETNDIFFVSVADIKTYLNRVRMPLGSAVLWVGGEFEIGEDRQLFIKDLKLVYVHERAFRAYNALNLVYQKKA